MRGVASASGGPSSMHASCCQTGWVVEGMMTEREVMMTMSHTCCAQLVVAQKSQGSTLHCSSSAGRTPRQALSLTACPSWSMHVTVLLWMPPPQARLHAPQVPTFTPKAFLYTPNKTPVMHQSGPAQGGPASCSVEPTPSPLHACNVA